MAQNSNRTPSHARQGGRVLQSFVAALETRSYYLVYTVFFAVAEPGDTVSVRILRQARDGYEEQAYPVTLAAR